MKTFSIMETQHNLSRVLKEVEMGNPVGITRRKKLVARILPIEKDEPIVFPDFGKRARELWFDGWTGADSDSLLDETRGER